MTETCRNKALNSQDIHHSWCFLKKEKPIKCSSKTQSQSFYDAFTAFLSSSCTVDLEENDVNKSLCPNAELKKLDLEDDTINLIGPSAANTGCNEEKLGTVNYNLKNCVSAENFVANFWLSGDSPSIKRKCSKLSVSLSLADSNMSRDWSACKAYRNENPDDPHIQSSGTGLRSLRSRDCFNKCSQHERKSSTSTGTFVRKGVNFDEELSYDAKKSLDHSSFASSYTADNLSRPHSSESQFLKPGNSRLATNVINESANFECKLQYKEEYRRKLRSARDAGEMRVASQLCHMEKARQRRLSTLRRRGYVSSYGHALGHDCASTYISQRALCRPVCVRLEKLSRKKIELLQNEMKMCAKVTDASKTSAIRKTGEIKSASRPRGFLNTSASTQMDQISELSRSDESEDDSNFNNSEEVISTLYSTRIGTNVEASQFCSHHTDISAPKSVKVAGATLNSDSLQISGSSVVGISHSDRSKVSEKETLLHLQDVSSEVLSISDTAQDIKKGNSNHTFELVEVNSCKNKHENTCKAEIEKTCSSRTNDVAVFEHSLQETSFAVCLLKSVDQPDFKVESDMSKVCNSSGSVNAQESVELHQVPGIHLLPFAITSDTTGLLKGLPKAFAESDILQDTIKSNATDILVQPGVDGAQDTSQTLNRVRIMKDSLNIFSPSLSEPMKIKSRVKSVESKPDVHFSMLGQCTNNSEYFPKSSNTDKKQKKRFSNLENDNPGISTPGAVSDYPKDCLKSIMATSIQSTKARKRKAEFPVALQQVSFDQCDDADAYVPNFVTHSQLLDEISLTEKWKEATDLEEWWLNDIGHRTNLSALSSTISSSATSEKSMSSEDFRWCAMLADQSEWPELELDFPTGSKESPDECDRNFPLTTDAEQGQELREEDANPSALYVKRCKDSQLLENHGAIEKLKCIKQRTCRVGKRKQVLWLKLKEAGSLSSCKLATTAGNKVPVANSELADTCLETVLSDSLAMASGVIELEADDKKHDQVDQVITTGITSFETLKEDSCEKNADNAAASPAFVGNLSVTSSASTSNSTRSSSVASVGILSPTDLHMNCDALFPCNLCDHTFSHTSSAAACCHAHPEGLCNRTFSVASHSTSNLNLKCNAAVGSICYNHSNSYLAPFGPNHTDHQFDSNSTVAPFRQNVCASRFNFNPFFPPFNNRPSFAYIDPHRHAASKSCFAENTSAASITDFPSDKVASISSERLPRCQTVSSEVKLNRETKSQDSSQCKTNGVVTSNRTLDLLTFSETNHTNTVKHVIPLTSSTIYSSSSAFDSVKTIDAICSHDSSSFAGRTEDYFSSKPEQEQSMVNNEVCHKPNFVYNDLNNSTPFPTSGASEKVLVGDKNICSHSFPGCPAKSKFELPVLRKELNVHRKSQENDETSGKDLSEDTRPCFSYSGLYSRCSDHDQGLSCDSSEAPDLGSENSSQDCPSEVSSKACTTRDVGLPSSDDAVMYSECNSDMCSWLAASMGLYTCDCGAAFSDSWSCQQHQSRCSAVIRT